MMFSQVIQKTFSNLQFSAFPSMLSSASYQHQFGPITGTSLLQMLYYWMIFDFLQCALPQKNYRCPICALREKIPMYIQLTQHQLLFKLGLANGLLMSMGLQAVSGYQQEQAICVFFKLSSSSVSFLSFFFFQRFLPLI